MDIFGIGPLEILFILILVLIIFGPKEIEKTGKTVGKSLNKIVRSDTWKVINHTSREIKNLPNRLMRDAGLDELENVAKQELSQAEYMIRPSVDIDSVDNPPDSFPTGSTGIAEAKPGSPVEQL